MSDDVRKAGVELVAENAAEFNAAIDSANSSLANMGEAAQESGGGLDILGEIATGALRKIGELAIEGVAKLGESLVDFVKDAMEGEKLIARLNSVITATGGAAGLTTADAQKLADQFKDLAGGSDEAVLSIEEMALRMGTVSGEQMPAFIQTTLDLAAATGQDATSAARLLAQAYDDPASAMSRFGKMGIRFDADLQDKIKAMMKAGDTAGAFALMMDRVSTATKGAAEGQANTLAGQIGIMQEHLADAGKAIGEAFLPVLKVLFDDVIKPAIPIVETIAKVISNFITDVVSEGGDLGAAFDGLNDTFGGLQETFGPVEVFLIDLVRGFQHLFDVIASGGLLDYIDEFGNIFLVLSDTLSTTGNPAIDELSLLLNNVGMAILPVQDAVAGLVASFQANWPILQATVELAINSVWSVIQEKLLPAIANVWGAFQNMLPIVMGVIQDLTNFIQTQWAALSPTLLANITNTLTSIVGIVSTYLNMVADFWNAHGATIMVIADMAWKVISTVIGGTLLIISGLISSVLQIINGDWTGAWQTIVNTLTTFLTMALNIIGVDLSSFQTTWKYNWDNAATVIGIVWKQIQDAVSKFIMDLTGGIQAFVIDAVNKFNDFVSKIKAVFAIDWGAVGQGIIDGIAAGIAGAVSGLVNAATNAAMSAFNAAKQALGISSPSTLFAEIGQQSMAGMAMGINQNASVPSLAASGAAVNMAGAAYSTVNNWNYSPTYGGAPYAPAQDFAIMQVMAG